MRRILRYFVFLITIVSSFFVINSKSEANELDYDYNVILEENEDNNSFVLKNKNDEIIYDAIVSTKIDKNLLEGESEDLVNLWYIPKNDFIEENGLSKDKDFNKNKENEKAYKVNSTEKFEFKLSDKAEYVREDHEYFEDYYRIIQTYKLNNSEYEVEHRILFPSYFEKKREEYLNRINPDLVLKFINRQDVSGFDKKAQKVNKKSIKKDKKISKNKEEKKDTSKNLDQSKEKTEEGNQENSDEGDSSGNNGDGSLDNGSDDPNKKIIYSGSLKDKEGKALANSEVNITDNNGNTIKVKTDEDGYFSVKLDKDSTYSLTSGDKKALLKTKGIDNLDLESDDFLFSAGKTINNKYGFMNFNPSIAYLNEDYLNYDVYENNVLVNSKEFNYDKGDVIVLPPREGFISGKALKIKNVTKIGDYFDITYDTPSFIETFNKVKMDTKDDGIDISEFSFVDNNRYHITREARKPRISFYSAPEEGGEEEFYLGANFIHKITKSADKDKFTVEYVNKFKLNDKKSTCGASATLDNGIPVGIKFINDKGEFKESNSIKNDPMKNFLTELGKSVKSVSADLKKKAEAGKASKSQKLELNTEFDFKIGGNLGLFIDYDKNKIQDLKIDFRNNFNVKNYNKVGFGGKLAYETYPQSLQSPYLVGMDLSFKFDAQGNVSLVVNGNMNTSTNFIYDNGAFFPNSYADASGDVDVEGEVKLSPGLKLVPYIGLNRVGKLAAFPTNFKIESTMKEDSKDNSYYGLVEAVINTENEISLKADITKYLEKLGYDNLNELELKFKTNDDLIKFRQVLYEKSKVYKSKKDEDGMEILDIGVRLGPADATIEEGLFDSFQGTNPGVMIKREDNGVYLYLKPEIATKKKSQHRVVYTEIPRGLLSIFMDKKINIHNIRVNQDDYYKDIVIRRNGLLENGETLKEGLLIKDDIKDYDTIDQALKRVGMENKVNIPNKDANTSVKFINLPNVLRPIKPSNIFDSDAKITSDDEGEYDIYVLRKELRTGSEAYDYVTKVRKENPKKKTDFDVEKDDFSDTEYYLDKFKLTIGDRKIVKAKDGEEKSNTENRSKELYYNDPNEDVKEENKEALTPAYVEDSENKEIKSSENLDSETQSDKSEITNTKTEETTESNTSEEALETVNTHDISENNN